ncbi:MAG: CO2 hydration protein [Microcystis panniformis Mp_MB_F_20051200_S9]|uniref:CO2 hydration protein n=1 Tax=Microcystis panniformis Mp_MB_F_20051200_S9 TaxID=2486223 RepID=A0A552PT94_9CHRO|nr:MAG: CO2 hydration protein [Microcystis panniformis Mp_GB_SS_20050300_S99]TRV50339.1 MAG: CO2 hydration protein [Microcystis panniformis Mp_MB_F_20080800_S26D]TRV50737.1 MAG: CO2 hydration protein [Microcystis panniformis Mp_GB_SS_20050300_S99D]TRV56634.1 MAG: CO2 hydration protein [Microcystis panniformis Mp_MB_F_20080800_S26]TRV60213.1 MAG: CO2 hydration protein [Microcystis panniformis Mp_MB_F_20051200_S9]TRV69327.1 MAG: CO2 hydration protein [Microcystis panniformis Mp_MB_F_20051200_S9D
MTGTLIKAKIPPSTHEFANIIHRLEAGGSMLPDTPENLMQIIGIYKAYAVPMDFYWRDLLYIAERVFLDPLPFFKYFLPQEYLDLQNHYAGDNADLRIWRGTGSAHPELLEFMDKGKTRKMPRLIHHLWHDRINMEFAEACMQAMLWHGRDMGWGLFDAYLDSEEYRQNADRAIKAYFKKNPVMMKLYDLFPDMFLEQVRMMSYYSNLGLFWEVMAPVFFEMSDIYDEGGFKGVPDAMNFLVNGIFAIAGRPIYHHVYIDGQCYEIIPKSKAFTWLYEAALPYVEAVFYRTAPFRGTKSYNAQAKQVPDQQKDFHYGILYADVFPVGTAGIPPTLLMDDMYHFLPQYLIDYYQQNCRGEDDILIQLGISFQRSMYNVTSAVIQALRTALLYPLDDPNPKHLLKNRQFFEAQMDRFKRPEARLRDIQHPNYR